MAKKITQDQVVQTDLWANTITSTTSLLGLIEKLNVELKKTSQISKDALKADSSDNFNGLKKTDEQVKKINKSYEDKIKLDKERIRLEDKLRQGRKLQAQQNEVLKQNLNQEAKNRRELAKNSLGLIKGYQKESKTLNDLRKKYKDLAVAEKENTKEAKALLNQITKLDSKLKRIDKTVGQSQREVGNYTSAFGKLGTSIKNIATGLIIVQGIRAIGRAFADAFNRVLEFDKELQNIAGITGKSRSELKDLEQAIVSVSNSSIRTSNEVAKLATTLFTLGKTEEEVKQLLKPVNDLSIAFRVSSDEAADFLGQTLNAFGKGAEFAKKYADIIANVRTSTSLDFQRIKDGLGFIAPTANALNLSLGETTALLGVLQDSGIRAARAGRLLNSSFARILEKGLTLEDALKKINESQNRITTSSELFGKEALALGLVLADNTKKTAALADEFDNLSSGSLDDLTSKQLDSLSAKITILNSSWEALVLSIENGTGGLSVFFKGAVEGITNVFNLIRRYNQTFQENLKEDVDENNKQFIRTLETLTDGAIKGEKKLYEEALAANKGNIKEQERLTREYNTFLDGANEEQKKRRKKDRDDEIQAELISYGKRDINYDQYQEKIKEIDEKYRKSIEGARNATYRAFRDELKERVKSESEEIGLAAENAEKELENLNKKREKAESQSAAIRRASNSKVQGDLKRSLESNVDVYTKQDILREKSLRKIVEEKDQIRLINILLKQMEEIKPPLILDPNGNGGEKIKPIIGLINNAAKAVADLNTKIAESVRENRGADNLVQLNAEYAAAVKELERLRRTAFSTRKEFDKQQRDLIENEFDKRIEEEVVKSKKTQGLITDNATASEEEKSLLLLKEQKRSAAAINQINFERAKKEIDDNEAFQLTLFEQSKRFAESEEDFQKRLAIKKEQLDIEALNAEIALRKEFFNEVLTDEIQESILAEQLKSDAIIKAIKKRKDLTDEQKDIAIIEEGFRLDKEINLLELQLKEGTSITIENLQKRKDAYTKFRDEQTKIDIDYFEVLRSLNEKFFTDQLNKEDRKLSDLERRQKFLQDLAARGNRDAAASLAQNQKDEAESLQKREKLLQREQQIELALSIVESYRTELSDPDNTTAQALTKAITSTSVLTGFIASLPSFYDGTIDTGSNGDLDSNGGHLAMLHDNERVVDKKNNSKFGGVSNDMAANIVHDFNNDLLSYNTPQLTIKEDRFDSSKEILNKFDTLEKSIVSAINNKETYLGSDVDTMKKLILQSYSKGNTKTIVQSKYRVIK